MCLLVFAEKPKEFLWVKLTFDVIGGGPVSLAPQSLPFHIMLQCPFYIPVTICFKNGTFSLHLSRESQVEIQ